MSLDRVTNWCQSNSTWKISTKMELQLIFQWGIYLIILFHGKLINWPWANLNSSLNLAFVFQLTCVLVCFDLIEVDVHLTRIFVAAKLPPGKPQFNLCKSFLQSEAIFLAKFLCLKLRCSALTWDFRHSSYPSKWPTCQLGNHNSISENLGKIQTSWQAP